MLSILSSRKCDIYWHHT